MSEVLTSAQVAEFLGVSANTIRSWKSRKADQLVEGKHWINQDNQVLWTQAGLEVLQGLQSATDSVAANATDSVADTPSPVADPLQRYSGLINAVADAITPRLLQRIDNAVTGRVKTAIAKPMTATECVTLLTELGLKPCNPELLLSGNQTNLLTESKE
jgi:hypothetical protein